MKTGALTGGFITVSNIESRDPAKVREGNERVVRPRLSDAAFFWDQDRRVPLAVRAQQLRDVTYQSKLGSYADKSARLKSLARWIGERISAGPDVDTAAELAKADLLTAMVGEFPELQGVMGRYYARAEGYPDEVARAIEEHYRPRFAGDALPTTKTGQALALADKIDTLVGIFAIGERPTGAKDPFGLRRAALGVLRILLESRLDLDLSLLLDASAAAQPVQRAGVAQEVFDFIAERLRGLFTERADGTTLEMIDAVLAARPASPLDADERLQALKEFMRLAEAPVLTALNKRIGNILRKAQLPAETSVEAASLTEDAERRLHAALVEVQRVVGAAAAERRYGASLTGLDRAARRRWPISSSASWSWTRTSSAARTGSPCCAMRSACWAPWRICRACPGSPRCKPPLAALHGCAHALRLRAGVSPWGCAFSCPSASSSRWAAAGRAACSGCSSESAA